MSTSAALPAGASITSINGKRCTAVPRTNTNFLNSVLGTSQATSSEATSTSSAVTTTSTIATTSALPPAETIAPAAAVPEVATTSSITPPVQTTSTFETISSTSTTSFSSSSISSSTLSIPPPSSVANTPQNTPAISLQSSLSSSTSAAVSQASTTALASSTSVADSQASTTALVVPPASSSDTTFAAKTTSSTSSTFAPAQSELSPVATSTNNGAQSGTATGSTTLASSTAAESTSAAAAASSGSSMPVGPMVGGILGGFALIGIVSFILWYLRRRKQRRDSFLTPLGSDSEPGDSRSSSRATNRQATSPVEKLRNQVGAKFSVLGSSLSNLKNKVRRDRKNSVNMNRGHSQFLEQIPQHSRQNSALSGQQGKITVKDRFTNWVERVKEDYLFKLRVRTSGKGKDVDPFAAAREKQAAPTSTPSPDFSQLLAMEERELKIAAERRRESLTGGSALGSLGLNFDDPFSDSISNGGQNPKQTNPFADPSNPFNDPANIISAPKPSQPPSSGYIADVRRSRSQSIAQTVVSRYPSSYAPDRDSYNYRDTYMSSATNGRKNKGRSDPFDLEKLQLEATAPPMPPNFNNNNAGAFDERQEPRVVSAAPTELSAAGTYESKYSSTALSDWGDPGPDLGPGLGELKFGDLGGNGGAMHARQDSDALGELTRDGSVRSVASVGKAM